MVHAMIFPGVVYSEQIFGRIHIVDEKEFQESNAGQTMILEIGNTTYEIGTQRVENCLQHISGCGETCLKGSRTSHDK